LSSEIPPNGYSVRAPTISDARVVAELIAAAELVDGGRTEMTVEELMGDWQEIEPSEEAVVATAPDGSVAAYADVLNRSYVSVSVYGYVHPEHRGRGVGAYLVRWGEEWTRDRIDRAPEDARVVVQHYVNALNESAQRLLRVSGYAAVRGYYRMAIELEQAPTPREWPVGIEVRTFVPERDERAAYEAVEDAFRDIWGRPRGTFERFLRFPGQEGFDPGLWFLAEDGGEISGVCLCKTIAGRGEVDVVAVRRPWRNRGLGLALLRHAFGEFYRRGVRGVGLSVDAESTTGAPRLYGRAGMRVAESYTLYQKELRPGRDVSMADGA
jgi:mycothiol synthase